MCEVFFPLFRVGKRAQSRVTLEPWFGVGPATPERAVGVGARPQKMEASSTTHRVSWATYWCLFDVVLGATSHSTPLLPVPLTPPSVLVSFRWYLSPPGSPSPDPRTFETLRNHQDSRPLSVRGSVRTFPVPDRRRTPEVRGRSFGTLSSFYTLFFRTLGRPFLGDLGVGSRIPFRLPRQEGDRLPQTPTVSVRETRSKRLIGVGGV